MKITGLNEFNSGLDVPVKVIIVNAPGVVVEEELVLGVDAKLRLGGVGVENGLALVLRELLGGALVDEYGAAAVGGERLFARQRLQAHEADEAAVLVQVEARAQEVRDGLVDVVEEQAAVAQQELAQVLGARPPFRLHAVVVQVDVLHVREHEANEHIVLFRVHGPT